MFIKFESIPTPKTPIYDWVRRRKQRLMLEEVFMVMDSNMENHFRQQFKANSTDTHLLQQNKFQSIQPHNGL